MSKPSSFPPLSRVCHRAGLDWNLVRPLLPSWHQEALKSEVGITKLDDFMLRHLGVGLLQEPVPEKPTDVFAAARRVATAVARIVVPATSVPWTAQTLTPTDIQAAARRYAANQDSNPPVYLRALLETVWNLGIPVVQIPRLPVIQKKVDAMVTFAGGRPVIVVCHEPIVAEIELFRLAYCLGHIALEHLPLVEGAILIDREIVLCPTEDAQAVETYKFFGDSISPDMYDAPDLRYPDFPASAQERLAYETAERNQNPDLLCRKATRTFLNRSVLGRDTQDFLKKLRTL